MTQPPLHNSFLQALCLKGERREARRKKERKRERGDRKRAGRKGGGSLRLPGGACEGEGEADQRGGPATGK